MARAVLSAGAIMAVASTPPALAGAWSTNSQLSVGATYDDNVLFVADSPIQDYYGRLDATGSLQYVGDHSRLELQPRLTAFEYASVKAYNRVDQYLKASYTETSERAKSLLSLSGSRDTTLTSEVGSTGLTQTNRRHEGLQASWAPSYQVTEKFSVGTQLSAQTNRYRDAAQTSLLDYDYGAAALNAGYTLSALSTLKLQASASRLQVPNQPRYTQKNYATTFGYSRHVGEHWEVNASYGPSWIQTRALNATSRGDVYHFGAARTGQRGNFTFGLDQDVTPNGFGVLARRQAATLDWRHAVSERFSVGISGQYSRTRNLLPLFGFELSRLNYGDASASLDWTPTPTWYISFNAGYGNQGLSNAPRSAHRTHAALTFSWTGLERVLH